MAYKESNGHVTDHVGSMTSTFQGIVTSSITRPFDSP